MRNKRILLLSLLLFPFSHWINNVSSVNGGFLTNDINENFNLNDVPKHGHISYKLVRVDNPNSDELSAYKLIEQVLDSAIHYYNLYTTATKHITVYYVADNSVRADGNFNGNLRFGPNRTFINVGTAIHEISHTIGVGTTGKWKTFGVFCDSTGQTTFSGKNATKMLRQITGDAKAQIFMDSQHFWPYGLNYANEYKTESDAINHCEIVNAMIKDGL